MESKRNVDSSYAAWPAPLAFSDEHAMYIAVQAVPAYLPLSGLAAPPQPTEAAASQISDAVAVGRGSDGQIYLVGNRLEALARVSMDVDAEHETEVAYWKEMTGCKPASGELSANASVLGEEARLVICGESASVYIGHRKFGCVLGRLPFAVDPDSGLAVGASMVGGSQVMLYQPGDARAAVVDCSTGEYETLTVSSNSNVGVDDIVKVNEIFRSGNRWLMLATCRSSEQGLMFVLFAFGEAAPTVLGSIDRSTVYVSEKHEMIVRVQNDTLHTGAASKEWTVDVFDLRTSAEPRSQWAIDFEEADGGQFAYRLRAKSGAGDVVRRYRASLLAEAK